MEKKKTLEITKIVDQYNIKSVKNFFQFRCVGRCWWGGGGGEVGLVGGGVGRGWEVGTLRGGVGR